MNVPAEDVRCVTQSLRAWAENDAAPTADRPRRRTRSRKNPQSIRNVLVFDTETTTDEAQALRFGFYRWGERTEDGQILVMEEGLFHSEDLDQGEVTTLADYARKRSAVSRGIVGDSTGSAAIQFMTRQEFVEEKLFRALKMTDAAVVMFNAPFDISRIAVGAGESRGAEYGGFTFDLWSEDHPKRDYRPRGRVRSISSAKAFIRVTQPQPYNTDTWNSPGRFIDLKTLAHALSDRKHSLSSACDEWKTNIRKSKTQEHGSLAVDYLDYARQDVAASTELCEKLLDHFYSLGIPNLEPDSVYSPASIVKATIRGFGISPPMRRWPDFPRDVYAAAMEAFYGGRTEVMIRRTHLPVQTHDFKSMYPTVNTLMGLWRYLIAEEVRIDDATEDVRSFLESVAFEDMFDLETWQQLTCLVQVIPEGDVLPTRADYSETTIIGINPVWSSRATFYTLADLVASRILTGKIPTVVGAYRLTPVGTLSLNDSHLGAIDVHPSTDDMFRKVIEARDRIRSSDPRTSSFLKVFANSGSYGIFSEFNAEEIAPTSEPRVMTVTTPDETFSFKTHSPEKVGTFCFPPLASFITGAARLMLALLEKSVTDAGGSWVFCDTDSMAIVATEKGGPEPCHGGPLQIDGRSHVRALSFEQTAAIRHRFDTMLNPYDQSIVSNILKPEYEAVCFAISAKRYAAYTLSGRRVEILRDSSGKHVAKESGLGYLLNPNEASIDTDVSEEGPTTHPWIPELWAEIIRVDLDLPALKKDPRTNRIAEYRSRAPLSRVTVSTPHVWRTFSKFNRNKSWRDQVKPFNFILRTSVVSEGAITEPDTTLIALFSTSPGAVTEWEWFDKETGDRVSPGFEPSSTHRFQTMLTKLRQYGLKRESKYLAPVDSDSPRQNGFTEGLLRRTPTVVTAVRWIGKEMNRISEIRDAMIDASESLTIYETTGGIEDLLAAVPEFTARDIARILEESDRPEKVRRSIRYLRQIVREGHRPTVRDREELRKAITEVIVRRMPERLSVIGYRNLTVTGVESSNDQCRCGCQKPRRERSVYATQYCAVVASRRRQQERTGS